MVPLCSEPAPLDSDSVYKLSFIPEGVNLPLPPMSIIVKPL